ncbi:hypothetical protein G3I62_01390 [Streptomyces sp. SID14446]|uniref:hypothetical protein n=1 Tax=Streptomyces sp. SID14446 TaxID=2706072 RepID=UPI0013BA8DCC|nr:hypothetical protein [Streptomyces sp. SID14446]NEB27779.1 hypothetical protein [Streptomyces sp. SID14446]
MNNPEIPTPSTQLVIPYFRGDRGLPDRPIPDPWYYCPSIRVTGTPGPFTFTPGSPMDVTVDVANYGAGTSVAAASVIVWWADPTTGFTTLNWFGQAVVAVPSHGTHVARTKPITGTIPASAPPHVCLLARVTALASTLPQDTTPDPINEPHWAQLNLTTHPVTPEQTDFAFSWQAGNPGKEGASYRLLARPADERALQGLALALGATPVTMPEMDLRIEEGDGPTVTVELDAGEQRRMHLSGNLTQELRRDTFTAVEVAQFDITENPDGTPVGAVGLIIHPDYG